MYIRSPPRGQGPAPGAPFRRSATVGYRCTSAFTPAGATLTSDGHAVYENGGSLRLGTALEIAAGRPRHGYVVTALTATSSGLAVAVAPVDPNDPNAQFAILVLDRETGSSSTFRTNLRTSHLAVAPDGSAFWYEQAPGHDVLQSLLPGGVPAGAPPIAASYAWSPDGRYLAVSLHEPGEGVRPAYRSDRIDPGDRPAVADMDAVTRPPCDDRRLR